MGEVAMPEEARSPAEVNLAFERARFDYSTQNFEQESARKETLERKAEFHLTFVLLILGAVFLNLDFLLQLRTLVTQASPAGWLAPALYVALGAALVAILVALGAAV